MFQVVPFNVALRPYWDLSLTRQSELFLLEYFYFTQKCRLDLDYTDVKLDEVIYGQSIQHSGICWMATSHKTFELWELKSWQYLV